MIAFNPRNIFTIIQIIGMLGLLAILIQSGYFRLAAIQGCYVIATGILFFK